MTFQEKLAHTKQRIESGWPEATIKTVHGATRALEESGIQERVIKAGERFPDFTLVNQDNQPVGLKQQLEKGPVLLTFYRGVWCPYCNIDLANLNRYLPEIEAAGATMVAVSPEKPQFSKKIIEKQKLGFDILWDEGNQLASALGLAFEYPEALKSVYRDQWNINLEEYHGDKEWKMPMPARFLIRQDGTVQYAESTPDYTQRPDPEEVMALLSK